MSNLQLRIISAVVLAVVVVTLTVLGGIAFRLLAAAIAAAMFYEWCAMAPASVGRSGRLIGGVLLAVVLLAMVANVSALSILALLVIAIVAAAMAGRRTGQGSWAAGGVAYAGFSGVALGLLRDGGEAGLFAILFLFAVVWATDILAYFVGRAVGGAKLAPAISPGKTWSGALGGAVGGVLAGLVLATIFGAAGLLYLGATALLLSVVSQAGDLFEPAIKRRHGVKDSGRLIPGHGGVMDRVDGLVAAAVALYLIGWWLGGADNPAQGLFAM